MAAGSTATASSWPPRQASARTAGGRAGSRFRRSPRRRMEVEQIDLIQLHCLVHPDEWGPRAQRGEEPSAAAVEAAPTKDWCASSVVTGHGLTVAAMPPAQPTSAFAFDSVLFPYSHVIMRDETYAPVRAAAAPRPAVSAPSAVQTIKSISPWPTGAPRSSRQRPGTRPLVEQEHIDLAVHWVLGEPGIFLNSAGDLGLLPRVLDCSRTLLDAAGRRRAGAPGRRPAPQHALRVEPPHGRLTARGPAMIPS